MVVDRENKEKGDIVSMSARDFKYLYHHDRVAEATKENVAAVLAEVASEKEAQKRAAVTADELTTTKALLAAAQLELATLKKAK